MSIKIKLIVYYYFQARIRDLYESSKAHNSGLSVFTSNIYATTNIVNSFLSKQFLKYVWKINMYNSMF